MNHYLFAIGVLLLAPVRGAELPVATATGKPNIILCMTDDQGWGDVGYNGMNGVSESAGINRLEIENERVLRRTTSP